MIKVTIIIGHGGILDEVVCKYPELVEIEVIDFNLEASLPYPTHMIWDYNLGKLSPVNIDTIKATNLPAMLETIELARPMTEAELEAYENE